MRRPRADPEGIAHEARHEVATGPDSHQVGERVDGPIRPGGIWRRRHRSLTCYEFNNTQNDANHIHSVWRNMLGDFAIPIAAK